jgi:hypothetical protein
VNARVIDDFRNKILNDEKYHKLRRDFHENYEWLEAYWGLQFGNNGFEQFCKEYGTFFWSLTPIREFARNFAFIECVGSSNNPNYEQTQEIAKATMFLRYQAGLTTMEGKILECSDIKCRDYKLHQGLCNKKNSNNWGKGDPAAFRAVMYIIRQIRNNLFHGNKLELEKKQYERNKELIKNAEAITRLLLDNLKDAEKNRN